MDEANRLAHNGMVKSYACVSDEYRQEAQKRLDWLIANYTKFTSDDIVNHLQRIGVYGNNSALGTMFVNAKKLGSIEWTGKFQVNNRPELHKRAIKVWQSKKVNCE